MKLLIDTNVVLDVLLNRQPFCENAARVLKMAGKENTEEYVSASAITDIYYIAHKQLRDRMLVKELLGKLLKVVGIAAVSENEIRNALNMDWKDFEDSVQYSVAKLSNMDGIVTRNTADYEENEIPIWTPEQVLNME